jgi:hypothetical protein
MTSEELTTEFTIKASVSTAQELKNKIVKLKQMILQNQKIIVNMTEDKKKEFKIEKSMKFNEE